MTRTSEKDIAREQLMTDIQEKVSNLNNVDTGGQKKRGYTIRKRTELIAIFRCYSLWYFGD